MYVSWNSEFHRHSFDPKSSPSSPPENWWSVFNQLQPIYHWLQENGVLQPYIKVCEP